MKKLVAVLVLCLLPLGVYSAEYDEYVYTPEQGIEMISYVALKDNGQVYKNLRDLTLMGIFRQERNFSLANYVTSLDALKIIFRVAGLEDYAYNCGEDMSLRAGLGVPEGKEYSVGDGFFIAAYQKGLIDKSELDGYFNNKPGCRATDYVVRQDIVVWLAKLFDVPPVYDSFSIKKYGNISLISPGNRPYFEGLFTAGISVSDGGSYKPCRLVKNSELVTLITRFYPYLLKANGIETVKDEIFSASVENNELTVLLKGGDIIKATPDKMCLVVGNNYVDNLYILNKENIKNTPITYYVKAGKIIFVSVNMIKPEASFGTSFSGKLYFYDDLTGAVVLTDENGKYREYFLAEGVEITENGEKIPAEKLMELTDRNFNVQVVSCNAFSLKKITKLECAIQ